MQCNCSMGVFPEVERAWLTIDSDIYVWKYEDGGDLAYYDGLTGTNLHHVLFWYRMRPLSSHPRHNPHCGSGDSQTRNPAAPHKGNIIS